MRTCGVCRTRFPGFVTRCLCCGAGIGPSTYERLVTALNKYQCAVGDLGEDSPWIFMLKESIGGATPEQIAAKVLRELRGEVHLFYDGLASRISSAYPR